jgi:lipopolysaccharide heptosyltransferase I
VNVALVRLSSLGDVVHALPVAAALRAHAPGWRLTWIVERREAALLRGNPVIDEVVPVDTRQWRRARRVGEIVAVARAVRDLRRRLREARFDAALDLQGLVKSGLLTAATGAPLRIGYAARRCREPASALFTNRRVTPPSSVRHVVEQNLTLLAPLGVPAGDPEFPLGVDREADLALGRFFDAAGLKPRDRVVVLNPGAGRADKRWPVEHFRELGRRLVDEGSATVLVAWGPDELRSARQIVDGAGRPRALLAPPTGLAELAALLRRASVVVAADTGPLHLAAALGTRCVGLYGPTAAVRNGPYGERHRALQSRDGRVASLEPDAVFRVVADVLG